MAHTQYIVVRDQGQWKISLNGVHYGPYATQRDAIRAAVDAAHEAGRMGLNGQVLLRDQFRIEWTYGKDPYPPHSSDFLGPYANAEQISAGVCFRTTGVREREAIRHLHSVHAHQDRRSLLTRGSDGWPEKE